MDRKLSHSYLRKILRYEPETGQFVWIKALSSRTIIGSVAGFAVKQHKRTNASRQIVVCGKQYLSHRLAWFWMTGRWPPAQVDHIDLDPLNNRWENLRLATPEQNQANRRCRSDSRSRIKGATLTQCGKYTVQIYRMGKRHYLGTFNSAEAAQRAYKASAIEFDGEFLRTA